MRKIRLDLFICMIIAGVLFAGIWFVGDKIGLFDIVFEGIGTMVDGSQDVPDGEVGGYATEDTPRVSTMQEVVAMARAGKTFDAYYNADSEEKVRLTKEMILRAIKKVKSKGKFDYDQFVADFKEI